MMVIARASPHASPYVNSGPERVKSVGSAQGCQVVATVNVMLPNPPHKAARAQVLAQYGPDSNAIQLLGLKKKSERKRPARRVPAALQ